VTDKEMREKLKALINEAFDLGFKKGWQEATRARELADAMLDGKMSK